MQSFRVTSLLFPSSYDMIWYHVMWWVVRSVCCYLPYASYLKMYRMLSSLSSARLDFYFISRSSAPNRHHHPTSWSSINWLLLCLISFESVVKQHTQHHQRVSSFLPVGDNCAKFARRGALTRDPIACLAAGWRLLACFACLLGCSIIWFDWQCVQYSTVFRQNEKGKREKEGKGLVTGKKEYTQSVSQSVSQSVPS